ncbi:MAG: sulfite exporter TauE/SafE family protein [Desulfomonilia bacterium]|nr:sulfite exporter TauE/SafE family protein [Desulfomonilia bacterium]
MGAACARLGFPANQGFLSFQLISTLNLCFFLKNPHGKKPDTRRTGMIGTTSILLFLLIGIAAGISSGLFGIGGGVIIVPALVFIAGFSQHSAVGTSLAILLPPVGLAAVIEFYRHGHVDIKVGLLVALGLFLGAWLGAFVANKLPQAHLRLYFGLFVIFMGGYIVYTSLRKLGTL